MANNEPCKHCGYNESEHDDADLCPEACDCFESIVEHLPGCPEIGCNGNCAATNCSEGKKTVHFDRLRGIVPGG